jgi:hypothetical protein
LLRGALARTTSYPWRSDVAVVASSATDNVSSGFDPSFRHSRSCPETPHVYFA